LTFYPGANEAAVVFGTSVGGWKKPNKHFATCSATVL